MARYPVRRAKVERMLLGQLGGRTLARDVVAAEDVPSFERSMVDGYAVHYADVRLATREQPARLRLSGEVHMGKAAGLPLRPGCAIAVPTGGALPAGTSAVVKIEDTERQGDDVLVFDAADSTDRITHARSDVAQGDLLFRAGKVLDPASLGLLAAAGIDSVEVYVPPAIGVLVTGDELVAPGAKIGPGQIRESNGIAICAALLALGFAPKRYERVPDDRDVFKRALHRALQECDGLLISGGSSVGARDFTPELVNQAGSPGVIVHGVRVRPGRPVLLAMIEDRPVIGLPGNPVSALIMFESLAKPILLRMFDRKPIVFPMRARLIEPLDVEAGLEQRIPVQLSSAEDGLTAKPLIGTSSQLHILAFADAFIIVPEDVASLPAGSWVDAVPFNR
jgi:molybdopterin molybdotransferase